MTQHKYDDQKRSRTQIPPAVQKRGWGTCAVWLAVLIGGVCVGSSQTTAAATTQPLMQVIVRLSDAPLADALSDATPDAQDRAASFELAALQRLATAQSQLEGRLVVLGARVRAHYTNAFNGFWVSLPSAQLDALRAAPGVADVTLAQTFRPRNGPSVDFIRAPQFWQTGTPLPLKGDDVCIGIIDSGIDYTHALLGGSGNAADYQTARGSDGRATQSPPTTLFPTPKVRGGIDLVGYDYDALSDNNTPMPDPNPIDDGNGNGHGTFVSGVAAGRDATGLTDQRGEGVYGVAPHACLYAIKVFGTSSLGTSEGVLLQALDYALDPQNYGTLRRNIRAHRLPVVNLSLGSDYADDIPLNRAIRTLTRAGTVVVAAGGEGTLYAVDAPGSAADAISVGGTQETQDHALNAAGGPALQPYTFKPDVAAPAFAYSAWYGTGSNTQPAGGTSTAAAHVSGAVALLRQAHPDWTPQMVKLALMNTAVQTTFQQSYKGPYATTPFRMQGAGRIDVLAAGTTTTLLSTTNGQGGLYFGRIELDTHPRTLIATLLITNLDRQHAQTYGITATMLTESDRAGATLDAPPTVTVKPGGVARIRVRLHLDPSQLRQKPADFYEYAATRFVEYDGQVTVTSGSQSQRVPVMVVPLVTANLRVQPHSDTLRLTNGQSYASGGTSIFTYGQIHTATRPNPTNPVAIVAQGARTHEYTHEGSNAVDRYYEFAVVTTGVWQNPVMVAAMADVCVGSQPCTSANTRRIAGKSAAQPPRPDDALRLIRPTPMPPPSAGNDGFTMAFHNSRVLYFRFSLGLQQYQPITYRIYISQPYALVPAYAALSPFATFDPVTEVIVRDGTGQRQFDVRLTAGETQTFTRQGTQPLLFLHFNNKTGQRRDFSVVH